ncbi:MAG: hypothetical protein ACOCPN_03510 [Desulfonatronovibrionaceae bacterium]
MILLVLSVSGFPHQADPMIRLQGFAVTDLTMNQARIFCRTGKQFH